MYYSSFVGEKGTMEAISNYLESGKYPEGLSKSQKWISGKGQLISLSKMVFYIMLEVEKRVLFHAKLFWIRRHNNLREC